MGSDHLRRDDFILKTFDLDERNRNSLWEHVVETVESYITNVHQVSVSPELNPERIRSLLELIKFSQPLSPIEAVNFVVQGLSLYQVHVSHPRYFGLFNPAPTPMSIAADALVATFNPQLASWAHSPFAVEVERYLIHTFGQSFGFNPDEIDGTFATGGAEANRTAILTALTHKFPEFAKKGVRGLERQPTLYVSTESHHSFIRAARACGLGTDAVRQIPVDDNLQINVKLLIEQIQKDRAANFAPFFVVATAGTTNAGIIDPIPQIAEVASQEKLWFHMDAAWGGAVILVPEYHDLLSGIELSDSITFDAHKWLSVPMGAGIYLTRHREILDRTFSITADYLPTDTDHFDVVDPYKHSIQCSRRFIGLKVFLSFAVAGWKGYQELIRHQVVMGDLLRDSLEFSGWEVINKTKLPIVCFVDRKTPEGRSTHYIEEVARRVIASGDAWISTTRLKGELPVLRACITNYRTTKEDVLILVKLLNEIRKEIISDVNV